MQSKLDKLLPEVESRIVHALFSFTVFVVVVV